MTGQRRYTYEVAHGSGAALCSWCSNPATRLVEWAAYLVGDAICAAHAQRWFDPKAGALRGLGRLRPLTESHRSQRIKARR